jgi:hypothetical protein
LDLRPPLDSAIAERHLSAMKLKTPRTVGRRKVKRKAAIKKRRPNFADFAKRVSGMMEGPPDLSSREGFGR